MICFLCEKDKPQLTLIDFHNKRGWVCNSCIKKQNEKEN